MDDLFLMLAFLCIIALILGMIKPELVVRGKIHGKRTRKKVVLYYGIGAIVFSILFGSSNTTAATDELMQAGDAQENTSIVEEQENIIKKNGRFLEYKGKSYKILVVDGGNTSGKRQASVAVDIGFGERIYWALTNEHKQLVYVLADNITLQDHSSEAVNYNGRYYNSMANVPGTEDPNLDKGHVIADSLGGVANAYNITPQNSGLNRYGNQAYMEKIIRDGGGCSNFVATITYPNTSTQIPSHYNFKYILRGNGIVDDFDNIDPDKANNPKSPTGKELNAPVDEENEELARIDTNGNGIVTIAEAKAAGYSMPIYSYHWLYKYMSDNDGDGKVGK